MINNRLFLYCGLLLYTGGEKTKIGYVFRDLQSVHISGYLMEIIMVKPVLSLIPAVFVLAVTVTDVNAQATTRNGTITYDTGFYLRFIPCAGEDGDGEFVLAANATFRLIQQEMSTPGGMGRGSYIVKPVGDWNLIGQSTGLEYKILGMRHSSGMTNGNGLDRSFSFTSIYRVFAPGSGLRYDVRIITRIMETPSGNVVAEVDHSDVSCGSGGGLSF